MTSRLLVALVFALALAGCGRRAAPAAPVPAATEPRPTTAGASLLAMLPLHPQVVIEIDVARLRANAQTEKLAEALIPTFDPIVAHAQTIVIAAYGVGTTNAATLTLVRAIAKESPPNARKIGDDIFAIGPSDWLDQVAARAATAGIAADRDLLALRDHAMPDKAPGASLRVTAQLSFDARIALARMTGLEAAPEKLSIWLDVADDLAMIIDADGGKDVKLTRTMVLGALASLAKEPTVGLAGLRGSLDNAKVVTRGTWVRAIVAIGPEHLARGIHRILASMPPPSEHDGTVTSPNH